MAAGNIGKLRTLEVGNRGDPPMKRIALVLVASCIALPALADEVGVRVGPAEATVGAGRSETVVKEKEVVKEREPRDKVIVKEHNDPVVEKKTIIER